MTFQKPFYRYSSKNIHGQAIHPYVKAKREKVLNLWLAGQKVEAIADAVNIAESTVRHYVRMARVNGDLRARSRRRTHYKHRQTKRQERDEQITILKIQGFTNAQIAKMCNCTERLVYLRLKEAKDDAP